jgi:hypothetical protein
MQSFWDTFPLVVFLVILAVIVKIIVDNSTRRKLIDKGMVDENVKYLFPDKIKSQTLSSLKWGMVSIGVGLAVFVGQMFGADLVEEVTIGAMFVFAGLALVIYYPIANRMMKKAKEENNQSQRS